MERHDIEKKIEERCESYTEKKISDLKKELGIIKKTKDLNNIIVQKIIFEKSSFLSFEKEYIKNNFMLKTVRVSKKGKVKESMSFPKIDYYDISNNDWENSKIYEEFCKKRFVFFVFEEISEKKYKFSKIIFHSLFVEDKYQLFLIFEKVKTMLYNNNFKIGGKYGFSITNFPSKRHSYLAHIRPHDSNMKEGKNLLPNGERVASYCFWFNNKYIEKVIERK